jgi:hypothetical protein
MNDKAQPNNPVTVLLTIQVTGEPMRVSSYLELLQMELRTTIDFMAAMYRSAEPERHPPNVVIHPPVQQVHQ